MPLELLRKGVIPRHKYRFDLESFFWLLVWFCIAFDPNNPGKYKQTPFDNDNLFAIGKEKHEFLMNGNDFWDAFRAVDSTYRPLIKSWVCKAYCLVVDLGMLANQINREKFNLGALTMEDNEDDQLIDETRNKLERLQEKAECILTYERYMRALNVAV